MFLHYYLQYIIHFNRNINTSYLVVMLDHSPYLLALHKNNNVYRTPIL